MATVVDALLVTLGVDSSGVDRGMNQAQERINSGVKNIVYALSAPIMAVLAGFSAGAAVSAYTATATSLDRLSQSLGMSMESLQGWQYAAESAGAEAEEVGNFFRDMNDYIVDATTFDSGPLKDIAKELGISLKDAQGNIKTTEDVTLELADAFQKVSNQKAVAFGMQMSIDPGMIALLQKGRGEIEALIKAQKELGVYTKEDAEIASKARFAFMTLGRSIETATMPIARVVVPAITWLAERFTAVANLIRKNSQFVEVTLGVLAAVITARFIPSLYAMGAAGLKAMLPFAPLIALVAGLALVIDDLVAYINGGDSALAGLWSQFGTGEEILASLKATWKSLTDTVKTLAPYAKELGTFAAVWAVFKTGAVALGDIAKAGSKAHTVLSAFGLGASKQAIGFTAMARTVGVFRASLSALGMVIRAHPLGILITVATLIISNWDKLSAAARSVGAVISSAFTAAGNMFRQAFNDMLVVADAVGGGISATFDMVAGGISNAVSSAMKIVTSAFTTAKETVQSVWEAVFNWFKEKFQWILDAWGGISDLPGKIGDAVSGVGKSIADGAKGAFDKVGQWGKNVVDGAKEIFGSSEDEEQKASPQSGQKYVSPNISRADRPAADTGKTQTVQREPQPVQSVPMPAAPKERIPFVPMESTAYAAEAIPAQTYNSTTTNRTANITKTTTINGGINITGASDPQASGKAVSEAIRDNDDDLSFAVDTGVRQ